MALFARGDFGDDFVQNVTGGLRIYLSDDPDKSLIDRHRKDDPKVYAPTFPAANAPSSPKTSAALPQCTSIGTWVSSPSNGQCICPSGTDHAGEKPQLSGSGDFSCRNL